MENSRWLTILLIGLVLAGLVVGYFLLRNTFLPKPQPKIQVTQAAQASPPQQTPSDFVLGQGTNASTPSPNTTFNTVTTPSPTPTPAVTQLTQRAQQATTTLPSTGFQLVLAGLISVSAILLGWKLRKFPH